MGLVAVVVLSVLFVVIRTSPVAQGWLREKRAAWREEHDRLGRELEDIRNRRK